MDSNYTIRSIHFELRITRTHKNEVVVKQITDAKFREVADTLITRACWDALW